MTDQRFIRQLHKKNLKFTTEITTTTKIFYRNDVADSVSRTVRKLLNKTSEYEICEFLICKEYDERKGIARQKSGEIEQISNLKLNKTCKFEVTAIDDTSITMNYIRCDLVETSQLPDVVHQYKLVAHKKGFSMIYYEYFIELPIYAVRKRFIHSYCRTGHSLQGVTVQDSITLFDWD